MKDLDLLCIGELTIDQISSAEKITDSEASVKLESTEHFFGGRGGNFCVYSSLFGVNVGLIAAIGSDHEGSRYKKYLESKKIDVSNLFHNKNAPTSRAFFFSDQEKTRIFFYGGALSREREDYLEHIQRTLGKIAHDTIYCTSPDSEVNLIALQNSKAKTKIYAPSSNIYNFSQQSIAECLKDCDMLFLNRGEADFLEKSLKMGLDQAMDEFGIRTIVKTLGEAGSEIMVDDSTIKTTAAKPDRVVDSNGAGDAFAGALVANYLKTKDFGYSAKVASAVASFVVEEMGCQTSIPKMPMIKKRAGV